MKYLLFAIIIVIIGCGENSNPVSTNSAPAEQQDAFTSFDIIGQLSDSNFVHLPVNGEIVEIECYQSLDMVAWVEIDFSIDFKLKRVYIFDLNRERHYRIKGLCKI